MTDLSEEAKALFESARAAHEPSDADQRRVLRAVLQGSVVAASTLGASASAAALASSTSAGGAASTAAAAGGLGLAAKGIFGGIVLGVASFGLYHATRPVAPRAEAPSAQTALVSQPAAALNAADSASLPAAVAEPASEPSAAPERARKTVGAAESAPSRVRDAPATPAAAVTPSAAFPAQAEASSGPSALTEEARALADVQRAMREGRASQALGLLDEQRAQFHTGELAPERAAARIVALCALNRVEEARGDAARFLAAWPRSPLAARVRASCAVP